MPLISEVRVRVPEQTLTELTRQKDTSGTGLDFTVLQRACEDVEDAWMPMDCGVVYDGTDRRHVVIAVQGVVLALRSYLPIHSKGLGDDIEQWRTRCERLKLQTQLDRMLPRTTSTLDTSSESIDGEQVRPDGDRSRFDDMIPRAPRPGARDDDLET